VQGGQRGQGRAERPHGHIGPACVRDGGGHGLTPGGHPPTALGSRGVARVGSGGRVKAAGACSGGKAKRPSTSVMMPSLTIPRRESASGPRGRACSIRQRHRRRLQPHHAQDARAQGRALVRRAMVIVGAWRLEGELEPRILGDEHGPLRQQVGVEQPDGRIAVGRGAQNRLLLHEQSGRAWAVWPSGIGGATRPGACFWGIGMVAVRAIGGLLSKVRVGADLFPYSTRTGAGVKGRRRPAPAGLVPVPAGGRARAVPGVRRLHGPAASA